MHFDRQNYDDDDDDFGGGFEMELANMDLEGSERAIGEGPENQQTCVKWVTDLLRSSSMTTSRFSTISILS